MPEVSDFYPGTTASGILANKKSGVHRDVRCTSYAGMVEKKNVMTFLTP